MGRPIKIYEDCSEQFLYFLFHYLFQKKLGGESTNPSEVNIYTTTINHLYKKILIKQSFYFCMLWVAGATI